MDLVNGGWHGNQPTYCQTCFVVYKYTFRVHLKMNIGLNIEEFDCKLFLLVLKTRLVSRYTWVRSDHW